MLKIFTITASRPDFISLQLYSFQKHLKEPFEFIVINNGRFDKNGTALVNEECKKLDIQVVEVSKDEDLTSRCQKIEDSCSLFDSRGLYSNVNVAHAYALCSAWEKVISKEEGPIAILDSDIFLIEPINLTETLGSHHFYCTIDGRPHPSGEALSYIWPPVVLTDPSRLPNPETLNWWCGKIKGVPVDVGGQTYNYFKEHPELNVIHVRQTHTSDSDSCDFHPANYDEFNLEGKTLLHYRCGSNWNHKSIEYHRLKTEWLKRRIG